MNIPNLTCIGEAFELAIYITYGSEWLSLEFGWIKQDQLEVAEAVQKDNNAKAAAEKPPRVPDRSIIIYICATEADTDLYPNKACESRRICH